MNSEQDPTDDRRVEQRIASLVHNLSAERKQQVLELLLVWQQKEQREDERIPCLLAVDYTNQQRAYHDFIHDLSKGGVFIETREPFQVGEAIALTFAMPRSQIHFKVTGRIVRMEKSGIGIQLDRKLSTYQEEVIKKTFNFGS